MSQVYCWECEQSYARDEVLDIPIFKRGWTVKWCFNCVMKQLKWSDYRLIPKPLKYKKFRIESCEDVGKRYGWIMEELKLCFEKQFRKLKDVDEGWDELHPISDEIVYRGE